MSEYSFENNLSKTQRESQNLTTSIKPPQEAQSWCEVPQALSYSNYANSTYSVAPNIGPSQSGLSPSLSSSMALSSIQPQNQPSQLSQLQLQPSLPSQPGDFYIRRAHSVQTAQPVISRIPRSTEIQMSGPVLNNNNLANKQFDQFGQPSLLDKNLVPVVSASSSQSSSRGVDLETASTVSLQSGTNPIIGKQVFEVSAAPSLRNSQASSQLNFVQPLQNESVTSSNLPKFGEEKKSLIDEQIIQNHQNNTSQPNQQGLAAEPQGQVSSGLFQPGKTFAKDCLDLGSVPSFLRQQAPASAEASAQPHQTNYQTTCSNEAHPSEGAVKAFAICTSPGIIRTYNEDGVSAIPKYEKRGLESPQPHCSFFAVFDGHGGSGCMNYLKDKLHTHVLEGSEFPASPEKAIFNGVVRAEKEFLNLAQNQNSIADKSGSCCLIALFKENELFLGNIGDCRALVSQNCGRNTLQLTTDHKPEDPGEKARIIAAGGRIEQKPSLVDGRPSGPFRIIPGNLSVDQLSNSAFKKSWRHKSQTSDVWREPKSPHPRSRYLQIGD